MLFEVLGFMLISAFALCLLSELSKGMMFGIIGGLLIVFAGLWLIGDGNNLEIRTGSNMSMAVSGVINSTGEVNGTINGVDMFSNVSYYNETNNMSGVLTLTGSGTEGYSYATITTPMPIFSSMLGIITLLVGISIIWFYMLRR